MAAPYGFTERSVIFTPTSSVAGYDSTEDSTADESTWEPPQQQRHRQRQRPRQQQDKQQQQPQPVDEGKKLEELVTRILDERFRVLQDRLDHLLEQQKHTASEFSPSLLQSTINATTTPTAAGQHSNMDSQKTAIERRLHELHTTKTQVDSTYAQWQTQLNHELAQLHGTTWTSPSTPACPCECRNISTLLGPMLPKLSLSEDNGSIEAAVLRWCTRIDARVAVWGEEIICPLLCVSLADEGRLWKWYCGLGEKQRRSYTEGPGCWERYREAVVKRAAQLERGDVGIVMEKNARTILTLGLIAFYLLLWWCWVF